MAGRLPFDPGRARGSQRRRDGGGSDGPLTVSQLAAFIDAALRSGIPSPVHVTGEVSGFRDRTHWYFDLKDGESVVNAVMFASAARRSSVALENGAQVIARGRVEFYSPGGRVSLVVDRLEPAGKGALEAQLRRLVEDLRGRGWLDEERKRPLPLFPRRVAVVTSRTGAALQDVTDTARRRCPAVDLLVVDVRVQGARAAPDVAAAIRRLGARAEALGVGAILVTRGGGSMEDLWAFNEEVVAAAIVDSPIPVVAAIGHETDTTVAELVADVRCATPTQAAVRLVPDRADLLRQVAALAKQGSATLERRLGRASQRLEGLAQRPAMSKPRSIVDQRAEAIAERERRLRRSMRSAIGRERGRLSEALVELERRRPAGEHARRAEHVDQLSQRLRRVIARRTRKCREDLAASEGAMLTAADGRARESRRRLEAISRELEAVGPAAVLRRGYTVTTAEDGRAIRSAGDVEPGQSVRTRTADGSFDSVVGGDAPAERPDGRSKARGGRKREATPPADQMDLFGGAG